MLLDNVSVSVAGLAVSLTAVALLLMRHLTLTVHPLEPPVLQPRVPFFGHIVSMIREKGGFYSRLLYVYFYGFVL
jgi:hypothetical protein